MKVIFITSALTHYYNLVLSKLNSQTGLELIAVTPKTTSSLIGAGVFQTRDGVNFKVIELEEMRKFGFFTTFRGLSSVLYTERPDVVIVSEDHLRAFLLDFPVVVAMLKTRAALILKSIPFRYVQYSEALKDIKDNVKGFASLSPGINSFLRKTGLSYLAKRGVLWIQKKALQQPDAHVNYVEAYEYWDSYTVPRERIFITRNSPDTDLLFRVKKSLEGEPLNMPDNPYRLLHVGRLVKWKRVDMLLRAFAQVRKRFPTAELIIIGAGPEGDALKVLSCDLQLGTSVIFTGGVYDNRDLAQYFMASSLYVLAGMGGLSINEAMCFSLPVLCSVCDGTEKILVRDGVNGRYFRDGDEDDLVEKINWFFEYIELLPEMGLKSEQIIRNEVNINTVINGYLQALSFVTSNHRE